MSEITLVPPWKDSEQSTEAVQLPTSFADSSTLGWLGAATTHRGKRRQINEDSVFADSSAGLWVVADGMGGHALGDFASQAICSALAATATRHSAQAELAQRVDEVEARILAVNDELRAHSRVHCNGATIGSTVVALLANQQVGVVLWAGDSRLYRYRLGRLEQVTRDHNPAFDLFEAGGLSEADLAANDSNVITRAVGSQLDLHLDVAVFDIQPQDTFLLCSDGLYRELDSHEMRRCLAGDSPQAMSEELLSAALATQARDNVSVVVAHAGFGVMPA